MPTIQTFEEIEVWQIARNLNKELYLLLQLLIETKNYELNRQIERAAGSVMDNIAEGFERDGNREFIQFLAIAKGSIGEVRSQLYRAYDRGFLNQEQFDKFLLSCKLIGEKLGKFINYLNSSTIRGKKFR